MICDDCFNASDHHWSEEDDYGDRVPTPTRAPKASKMPPVQETSFFSRPGRIPTSYPVGFAGLPGEKLADWDRAVGLWIKGEGGELPTSVIGPRMLSVLSENAWMICQHISEDRAGEEDGRELIMKTLKDSPLLTDIKVNSGKVERREFLALRREAHESAESFTARALLYRHNLQPSKEICLGITQDI